MQKSLSALLFLLPAFGFSQVMQDQKAYVKYTQLPAVKINDGSNMYSVVIETPFLQKNQDSLAMYELTKQNYLKEVGDNCPVMKSIHPDIQVEAVYRWNN